MVELKPCPFCGGTAKMRHDSDGPGYSYVECEKCHMKSTRFMRLFERSSDEDAKAFWNRRTTDERVGAWELVGAGKSGRGGVWRCNACGKCVLHVSDYCPNCGATMGKWEEALNDEP